MEMTYDLYPYPCPSIVFVPFLSCGLSENGILTWTSTVSHGSESPVDVVVGIASGNDIVSEVGTCSDHGLRQGLSGNENVFFDDRESANLTGAFCVHEI